jgi:hypothetical protein
MSVNGPCSERDESTPRQRTILASATLYSQYQHTFPYRTNIFEPHQVVPTASLSVCLHTIRLTSLRKPRLHRSHMVTLRFIRETLYYSPLVQATYLPFHTKPLFLSSLPSQFPLNLAFSFPISLYQDGNHRIIANRRGRQC